MSFWDPYLEIDLWLQDNLYLHFPSSTKLHYYNAQFQRKAEAASVFSLRLVVRVLPKKAGDQTMVPMQFVHLIQ